MAGPDAPRIRELLERGGIPAAAIDAIQARDGLVQVTLLGGREAEPARARAEALLRAEPGVSNAAVVLTVHRPAPETQKPAPAAASRPKLLPEVRRVIAVASGKGGVGKSTIAVNLAVALAQSGLKVGLLDADIYGPSLPTMLGIAGTPELRDRMMVPREAWGVRALSIGLLVDPDAALVWRGPMVMGALEQLMGQAAWGALDVMVVDMPPGTGDAQLTMAQRAHLAGAVIVSTPQDLALIDARRAVRMFEKTLVPILGIVENMSVFHCPACGHATPLFGHGGARQEAERLGVPFLGEVPLLMAVREAADAGTPLVVSDPDSPAARAIVGIAGRVAAALG